MRLPTRSAAMDRAAWKRSTVTGIALAVIDALAEGVTIEMGVALERALSEGDGGRDLGGNYKLRALSSAIRAAKEGT